MTSEITPEAWGRQILQKLHSKPYSGVNLEWFGQEGLMDQIDPFLHGSDPFPHTLLLGEPGLGKTHLAQYIAFIRNEAFEETTAPADPTLMPSRGIVLLDEIHKQKSPEPLFELMKYDTPTIIAATTRPELVDGAFRSRFFLDLHLKPYTAEAMSKLIASRLKASDDVLDVLGRAAAGNPRQAVKIAIIANRINSTDPDTILATCQITADGLTRNHIDYLRLLKRMNKPIGLGQIATLLYADETSVKNTERLLLDNDLVQLNSTGRKLTREGAEYIKEFDGGT